MTNIHQKERTRLKKEALTVWNERDKLIDAHEGFGFFSPSTQEWHQENIDEYANLAELLEWRVLQLYDIEYTCNDNGTGLNCGCADCIGSKTVADEEALIF